MRSNGFGTGSTHYVKLWFIALAIPAACSVIAVRAQNSSQHWRSHSGQPTNDIARDIAIGEQVDLHLICAISEGTWPGSPSIRNVEIQGPEPNPIIPVMYQNKLTLGNGAERPSGIAFAYLLSKHWVDVNLGLFWSSDGKSTKLSLRLRQDRKNRDVFDLSAAPNQTPPFESLKLNCTEHFVNKLPGN